MVVFLLVLFVITCILLVGIVLLQDDQGDGLGGMFGGGSSSAFGSRSGNILTRFTSILAAVFLITAFGVAWLNRSSMTDDIEARARLRSLEEQGTDEWYIKTEDSENEESTTETNQGIESSQE
jgi:preprotein translocase subunit SecG